MRHSHITYSLHLCFMSWLSTQWRLLSFDALVLRYFTLCSVHTGLTLCAYSRTRVLSAFAIKWTKLDWAEFRFMRSEIQSPIAALRFHKPCNIDDRLLVANITCVKPISVRPEHRSAIKAFSHDENDTKRKAKKKSFSWRKKRIWWSRLSETRMIFECLAIFDLWEADV